MRIRCLAQFLATVPLGSLLTPTFIPPLLLILRYVLGIIKLSGRVHAAIPPVSGPGWSAGKGRRGYPLIRPIAAL